MMATADMIERADQKPKPPPRASWVTRKDSILTNPAGADDATEQAKTARTITRLAFGRHSCPRLADDTAPCGPEHDADVADALTVLRLLGLAPYELDRRKECTDCKQEKPVADFAPDPRTAGGVRPKCNACRRKEARQRRARKTVAA